MSPLQQLDREDPNTGQDRETIERSFKFADRGECLEIDGHGNASREMRGTARMSADRAKVRRAK